MASTSSDKDKKEIKRDILARDIPEALYVHIVELQGKALIRGERKSLGSLLIELAQRGAGLKE